MIVKRIAFVLLVALTTCLGCRVPPTVAGPVGLESIRLSPDSEIDIYADQGAVARGDTILSD